MYVNTYNFLLEGEYGFKVYLMHTFSLNRNPFSSLFCDKFQSRSFLFCHACLHSPNQHSLCYPFLLMALFVIILAHTLELSSRQFVWGSSAPTPVLQQTWICLKKNCTVMGKIIALTSY